MSKGKYRVGWDELRGDRIFVMNLQPEGADKWQLVTYRNTGLLPPVRNGHFNRFDEAIIYVERVEPLTPLDSLGHRPLNLDRVDTDSKKYVYYNECLSLRGLVSVLELKRHCPFWHNEQGWKEIRASLTTTYRDELFEGETVQIIEATFPLNEI